MATNKNEGITDPDKIDMTRLATTRCSECDEYFEYEFPIGKNYKCYQTVKCPKCGELTKVYTPFEALSEMANDFGGIRFL